jgi:hypothetical protein
MLGYADWRTGELTPKNSTLMKAARIAKDKFHDDEQALINLGMVEIIGKISCGRYRRRIPAKFLKGGDSDGWNPDEDGCAEGFV